MNIVLNEDPLIKKYRGQKSIVGLPLKAWEKIIVIGVSGPSTAPMALMSSPCRTPIG